MATGLDLDMKYQNGKLLANELARESHYVYARILLHVANSTEISFVNILADCIELFSKNLTDMSMGNFLYHVDESQSYYVPCANSAASLYMISGYEFNNFLENRRTKVTQKLGVLSNFANFSVSVYSAILLYLMVIMILVTLKAWILMRSPHKMTKLIRRSTKLFRHILQRTNRHNRIIALVFHCGLFLLATPFLLLFKTNQVVAPSEPFIRTYEDVITEKPFIYYSNILFDETALLKPSKYHVNSKDIESQIWTYFMSHSKQFNFNDLNLVGSTAKNISRGRTIFLGALDVVNPIMQTFCSFSQSPDLYRMSLFRDPNQRESLTGFALRRGVQDKKLIKRIRNLMEFHYHEQIPFITTSYVGFRLTGSDHQHILRQLPHCQGIRISEDNQQEIHPSDLQFFDYFFRFLMIILVISLISFY